MVRGLTTRYGFMYHDRYHSGQELVWCSIVIVKEYYLCRSSYVEVCIETAFYAWFSYYAFLAFPGGASGQTLVNPYAGVDWGTINQYKANLHTHSLESDGALMPGEAIDEYANRTMTSSP